MVKQIIVSVFILLFVSCEKEGDLTTGNNFNNTISNVAVLASSGTFTATSGISVTGEAKIYIGNNTKEIVLENFTISDGPDLKVYLSKSSTPDEFINLGGLTAATVYSIPQQVDLSQYKYVLIHCQQYNHLFAIAELK
ncbi:DM13 domain-containing protein [Flavobacterium sp.]|uniref:DM13 domain-containing protein n=1 Tax=Flavobacterium sp. TaxID=239 RepID=UPI002621A525|nr:DM13 domain-containing protein [Flavobacterium sp.]